MRNVMATMLIAASLAACSQNDKADRGERRDHAERGEGRDHAGRRGGGGGGGGGGGRDRGARFDRLDANKDGFVAKDEAPQRMQARFSRLDSDGDGKVSRDEFTSRGR